MNEKNKILVVDDQQENLKVVSGYLREVGYRIALSTNGEGAISILEEHKIDLVLLDIMMPGMDGFEVCRRIKAKPGTHDIPVIFLTAKVETEDIVKGFRLGGADYVTKPFNKEELLARVENHIRLKQMREFLEMRVEEITKSRNLFIKTLYDFGHMMKTE